jgi:NADH-quinone oxidoreductase subunit M
MALSILTPAVGAVWVKRLKRDPERAQRHAVFITALALLCTLGGWLDFGLSHAQEVQGGRNLGWQLLGGDVLNIDQLNAPLLPLAALLYLATAVATLRTKVKRYSFAGSLVSEAILLATLGTASPWAVVVLLAAGTVPLYFELRTRRKPTRVYLMYMGLFVVLLAAGQILVGTAGSASLQSLVGVLLLIAAVLVRSGIFPMHVWMTDLFERRIGRCEASRWSRCSRRSTRQAWPWCSEKRGGSSATCFSATHRWCWWGWKLPPPWD